MQLPRIQRYVPVAVGTRGLDCRHTDVLRWSHGETDTKVVYRRYASLFFVAGITQGDNELATLEIIHRYVEVLDRYFGNVSGTFMYILNTRQ